MHATEALHEADRLMTVCNSCRYCEGLCAVFPAMELRSTFVDGDLSYLANLCHSCGACFYDCQYAPPHAFNVNVPLTMATVRAETYATYAWPTMMSGLFARNGLAISLIAAACVALFILAFVGLGDRSALFASGAAPGAFYALMPHGAMAGLFGIAFLWALVAIGFSVHAFWHGIGAPARVCAAPHSIWQAVRDACSLRYLDGGGVGCMNEDDRPNDRRRLYHHLTFYGFMLCLVSTTVATLYHFVLGREAPYPWYDLPVMLGTLGGLSLISGCLGLLAARARRDHVLQDVARSGMDLAFLAMLLLTAGTGLALLLLRATPAMGIMLSIHLGVVFAFFITMPYGKFVHGIYRFVALVRYARELHHLGDT